MSSIVLSGDTSGTVTVAVPAVAGTNTVTIAAQTGTLNAAGPAFSVYPSGSTTIPNNSTTILAWNTKIFDTASAFNNTGSTATLNGLSVPAYSFCPPVAGYYQISGNIAYTTSTGVVQNSIFKNGASPLAAICPASSNGASPCVSVIVYLNGTGDYISLYGYQLSGGSYNSLSGRPDLNWIFGALVRGA